MKKNQEPVFLLTGTYSSFNKGDAAMQLSSAQALRIRWPEARIIICTPFPEYDYDTYQDYEIIKSHRRNLILASVQLVCASLFTLFRHIGVSLPFLLFTKEAKITQTSTIVIDLSGDTITEDYGPHVTYSHLLPLLYAHTLGTPSYICAQSMGPFKLTTRLVAQTLKKCSGVTAREKVTYDYLKTLGIPEHKLHLESDMAFLLKPAPRKRIDTILKSEKISLKSPTLGVTVSNIIRDRYNKTGGNFDQFFAQFLDKAIERLDMDVMFVGHVTGPSKDKDDRLVAKNVYKRMKHKKRASILRGNYSPQELKGVISKCSLFLGARMHSNIAAISSSVPTVAMSYSHKTIGIMGSVDMGKYVFSGETLTEEKLLDVLHDAHQNAKSLSSRLDESIPKVRASSQQNIANIKLIIEK